jgi:hypothetical protein
MSTTTPPVSFGVPTTPPVSPAGITPAELETIVKAASELFGTSVVAELEEDPEIDESYYRLRMKVMRDVDEVARLRRQWFEILWRLAPDHCHAIRLSVDYSP